MHLHALELASDLHHAAADDATVRFELGLARPPRADAAAEPLEVRPLPDEPRQQIRELRQLDLQLALARARALGEDVEDQRRPVDDLQAERLGHVALLARRERVVADDEVGRQRLRGAPELLDLPLAEVESRCRRRALLDDAVDDAAAGRRDETRELLERLLDLPAPLRGPLHRRDHRALSLRPSVRPVLWATPHASTPSSESLASIRRAAPSVAPAAPTSIHSTSGSRWNQVHWRFA